MEGLLKILRDRFEYLDRKEETNAIKYRKAELKLIIAKVQELVLETHK